MSPDVLSVLVDDRRRAVVNGYARARRSRLDRALRAASRLIIPAVAALPALAVELVGCIADDDWSVRSAGDRA